MNTKAYDPVYDPLRLERQQQELSLYEEMSYLQKLREKELQRQFEDALAQSYARQQMGAVIPARPGDAPLPFGSGYGARQPLSPIPISPQPGIPVQSTGLGIEPMGRRYEDVVRPSLPIAAAMGQDRPPGLQFAMSPGQTGDPGESPANPVQLPGMDVTSPTLPIRAGMAGMGQEGPPTRFGMAGMGQEPGRGLLSLLPYGLAGLADAIKENLTLPGSQGARGHAVENLLGVEKLQTEKQRMAVEEQRASQALMMDAIKMARQNSLDQFKVMQDLVALPKKFLTENPNSSPEDRETVATTAAATAKQFGVPLGKSFFTNAFEHKDLADLFGDNAPFMTTPQVVAALPAIQSLMDKGDRKEAAKEMQSVVNQSILQSPELYRSAAKWAKFIRQQQGLEADAEVPFDTVRDYILAADEHKGPAFARFLAGINLPDDMKKINEETLGRLHIQAPGAAAAAAAALTKQKTLMPGAVEEAGQISERTEESRGRVAERQGLLASGRQLQMAKEKPLGVNAREWENEKGQHPDPTWGIEEAHQKGFNPIATHASPSEIRRMMFNNLQQMRALVPKLLEKGFVSGAYNFVAVGTAKFNRALYPGDPDLGAFLMHAGSMVAAGRLMGDIGARAQAAYESFINVVKHPTSADSILKSIDQLEQTLRSAEGGPSSPEADKAAEEFLKKRGQ